MKRTLFLVLSLMLTLVISAGNVTPEEALQQATKFMNERVAKGARRAPVADARLTMAKNVSGLYVINVGQNDGFVIVSPDNRTETILGYGDSGSIDPDNMPENMRSWLQGYADEIAWLDAHNYQPSANAARRTPAEVKKAIAPLVTAHWNQDAPYNNQVQSYAPDGVSGVTGCVITAMTQVMYYTAKQAGLATTTISEDIPAYTTSSNKEIPGVSASEVIRWDLIRDTYNSMETDEGAEAVAALMRICGAAMEIDYENNVSSGQGEDSYAILQYYFGYDQTTQVVDRSYYSYANWIEMVYNELKQGRPMIYGGQSTSSGHEFVCDGYEGEDYFHINWGWGGMSDGYFQLSVLNAQNQGIGGSSSGDGYSTGQHAIVGIQLKGGTGTVLSNPNQINLTLNSVTTDKTTMKVGETAHLTFNITNNSADDYDGEIGIFFLDNTLGNGVMLMIPAGESKDCAMDFNPTSAGTYKVTAYKTSGVGKFTELNKDKYVEITVSESSTSTTSDIELTLGAPIVENAELVDEDNQIYYLYGNIFKATVRVTNPSTTEDYSGSFYWILLPGYGNAYKSVNISIPKNSYIDIPIEIDGLDRSESSYRLATNFLKGNSLNGTQWSYYILKPAIIAYAADGTATVTKSSGGTYVTPSTTLAVDLSGLGITTVVKNSNPNCLYILKTTDPVPANLTNVIKTDYTNYTAENIELSDGHSFYTPVDFTANNIEFTYDCNRWADGTNGWNTIMLPFDVTSVTADDTPIDWFHSSSEAGKQFWLKEFVGDDTDDPKVYFDYVSGAMQANTPYIIAMPGNHWGEAISLKDKVIKFLGSGVVEKTAPVVLTASNYRFVGNTIRDSSKNIYCISDKGDKFELKAGGGCMPFRAFFKPQTFDRSVESLYIGGDNETTGINEVSGKMADVRGEVYNLAGQRVAQPKKGLYIVNGVKVVVK